MESWHPAALASWEAASAGVLARSQLEQFPMLPRFVVVAGALAAGRDHAGREAMAREALASVEQGLKQLRWIPRQGASALLAPLLGRYPVDILAALTARTDSGMDFLLAHARAIESDAVAAACGKLHDDLYTLNRNAEIEAYLVAAAIARARGDAQAARSHTVCAWNATTRDGLIADGAEEAEATARFLSAVDAEDPHVALACKQLERFGADRGATRGMGRALLLAVRACVERASSSPVWIERALGLVRWIIEPAPSTEAWVALFHGARAVGDDTVLERAKAELSVRPVRDDTAPPWAWSKERCPLVPPSRREDVDARLHVYDLRGALALTPSDSTPIAEWADAASLPEVLALALELEAQSLEAGRPSLAAGLLAPIAARAASLGAVEVLLALRSSKHWKTQLFVAAGLTRVAHPTWRPALADAVVATAQCKLAFV